VLIQAVSHGVNFLGTIARRFSWPAEGRPDGNITVEPIARKFRVEPDPQLCERRHHGGRDERPEPGREDDAHPLGQLHEPAARPDPNRPRVGRPDSQLAERQLECRRPIADERIKAGLEEKPVDSLSLDLADKPVRRRPGLSSLAPLTGSSSSELSSWPAGGRCQWSPVVGSGALRAGPVMSGRGCSILGGSRPGITISFEFTLPALMTVVSERQPQWSRATTGENRIVAAWRWDGGEALLG